MQKRGSQKGIVFKNVPIIIERNDTQTQTLKLRKKWNIPDNGFSNFKEYNNWLEQLTNQLSSQNHNSSQYSLFLDDINKLRKSLKLSSHWNSFFAIYIPTDRVKIEIKLRSGKTYNTPTIKLIKKNSGEEKIQMEFGANTRLKDIDNIWHKVNELQKKLPDYDSSRHREKLSRDLLMLQGVKRKEKPLDTYISLGEKLPNDDSEYGATLKGLQRLRKKIKRQ